MTESNSLQNSKLKLTFCARGTEPPKATAQLLPILVDSCPDKFSTIDYFIVSKSQQRLRLQLKNTIFFADINHRENRSFSNLFSSYDIIDGHSFEHNIRSWFGGNPSTANIRQRTKWKPGLNLFFFFGFASQWSNGRFVFSGLVPKDVLYFPCSCTSIWILN